MVNPCMHFSSKLSVYASTFISIFVLLVLTVNLFLRPTAGGDGKLAEFEKTSRGGSKTDLCGKPRETCQGG